MFSKTEFSASISSLITQLLKDCLSPMKKKSFLTTGNKTSASKSNSNLPNIYHLIHFTMDHHLPLVLLTTATLLQAPSRTSSADTPPKLVITFLEGSAGIATAFQSNTKSIRNLKSPTRDKCLKWALLSTIRNAGTLS
jgi:hypothetical protein